MITENSNIRLLKLWEELKNWRHDWTKSTFFQALVFGLLASLFDCGTDFYFAWNVPKDCQHNDDTSNFQTHVSTPCGTFHYKNVEAFTYSAIALPGILLGMAGLQCLIRHILSKCFPGQIHWCIRGTANAISLALEVLFNLTLLFAATRNDMWTRKHPKLGHVYAIAIKALAYLSATSIIGVKFIGLFSHGPETSRLILRATDMETKYEACFQLFVVARIYLSSSIGTLAVFLSGLSSLVIIGKVSVQNLLEKHKDQVSECSPQGKIVLACTALPVSLLVTIFKIGSLAVMHPGTRATVVFVGHALSGLTLLVLKLCRSRNDQELTSINQSIIAEILTLHIWPKGRLGVAVGVGMTTFLFLLYSSSLVWHVANPEQLTEIPSHVSVNKSDPTFLEWRSETADQLQTASACLLQLGLFTFVFAICFTLYQDRLVTTILSKFPLKTSQEDNSTGLDIQKEKHGDTKNEVVANHEEIIAELDKFIMITPQKNIM